MISNLFQIKYKPYCFYSFIEKQWLKNLNYLNCDDVVTRVSELSHNILYSKHLSTMVGFATLTYSQQNIQIDKMLITANNNFWIDFGDNTNPEKKINLVKENFHIYFFDNQKTIIYKDLLEKIST